MNTTQTTLLTTATLAFTLTACQAPADEFRAALPDRDTVTVSYPEQTAQSEAGLKRQAIVGEPADFYTSTYYESRKINGFGAFVVKLVESITSFPATTVTENTATWGPFSDDREPNEFRLTVERRDAPSLHYVWALEGRPKSATDYIGIAGGASEPGAAADYGRGWFALDFTQIQTLNPAEEAQGRVVYAFEKSAEGLGVQVLFQGPDDNGQDATVGYMFGERTSGEGFVVFAIRGDIHEGDDATMSSAEDLLLQTRWDASGAGRADLIATHGDLGEQVATGTQCWDDTFVSTFEMFTLDGAVFGADGDSTTCRLDESMPEALPEAEALGNPFEGSE